MTAAARPDLRLVPATVVGWVVVLSGLYLGSVIAAALGVVGVLIGGAAALRGRRAGIVAVGGVAAALALVIGTQAWQVERHPLRAAAERGSSATVEVTLRDDPRAIASQGYGGQQSPDQRVVVHAALEAVEVAGRQWCTGGR
ncbi:MAG: competence protein ComEC, partial [Actinomycetota bacterium]|nr:competence protein ComEC [Actinomycetota bacterium]